MAFAWLRQNPLVRVLILYIALAAVIFLGNAYVPGVQGVLFSAGELDTSFLGGASGQVADPGFRQEGELRVLGLSLVGMSLAFMLMLPVVMVFTATRAKRGYRQAMVQTLVILPVVVAGVVMLVKNSVALAFSLGGIVGAVSFRNRLEDPKDAVYVFLSIAVGVACGVQVYAIAFSMSLFFNVVILGLWYTDFGRVPAEMGGAVGQRRVEMARGLVEPERKKGGEFISVLDQQVLRSMTPDQLGALAERALQHRQKMARSVYDIDERYDGTLRLVVPAGASEEVRAAVEAVLFRDAKEWRFDNSRSAEGGKVAIGYRVKLRKKVPQPLLLEAVRRAALPHAEQVTFE
jgi:hypothetical protein